MVTKDEDFLEFRIRIDGLQVLWLRVGNLPNRVLLQRLDLAWDALEARLCAGETLVVLDR